MPSNQYLTQEVPGSLSNQMPELPQLASFDVDEYQVYSGPSQITELPTLSLRLTPAALQRLLISATCIRYLILPVVTQSS